MNQSTARISPIFALANLETSSAKGQAAKANYCASIAKYGKTLIID